MSISTNLRLPVNAILNMFTSVSFSRAKLQNVFDHFVISLGVGLEHYIGYALIKTKQIKKGTYKYQYI